MAWKDILKNVDPYETDADRAEATRNPQQAKGSERDLSVGSTNYAKDLGDKVYFIQWKDDRMNPKIPKSELPALLDEFEKDSEFGFPVRSLQSITMSSGQNEDFVNWYNKKMGIANYSRYIGPE